MRTIEQLGHTQREFLEFLKNQGKACRVSEFVKSRAISREEAFNVYRAVYSLKRRTLITGKRKYSLTDLGRRALQPKDERDGYEFVNF